MDVGSQRLEVPRRAALEERFARAQARSRTVLVLEVVLVLLLGTHLGLRPPPLDGLLVWAIVAGIGGLVAALVVISATRGTPLDRIKPESRLGSHSRASIERAVQAVCGRLGLPAGAVRVFLTRSKDHNASALTWALVPGVGLHSTVTLDRGVLHLLDGPELESVIGHELGHALVYVPRIQHWYALHAVVSALGSVAALPLLEAFGFGLFAPIAVVFVVERLISWPWWGTAQTLELLCDGVGARAAGWLPALRAELKLGVEQEVRTELLERVLEAHRSGSAVPLAQLVEAYDAALPFGHADPAAVNKAVEEVRRLAATERDGELSVGGFVRYVVGATRDRGGSEELEQELTKLRLVRSLPKVELDLTPYLESAEAWTPEAAARVVAAIRSAPGRLMFRVESEVFGGGLSHPSPSRRLLYVWDHRDLT